MPENKKIKIGIPKGSLQEHTLKIFKLAGFNIQVPPRSYNLKIDDEDIEAFLIRPQEIPTYIDKGKLDVGITGEECIVEARADVVRVRDLRYAKQEIKKVRWVLAVPKNSDIKSVKDLEGKTISTEIVNIAKDYLEKNKVKATVKFSWGATEVKPPRFEDAIVDLIETGISLEVHNLKILDTVFESSTKLIANKKSIEDPWKKQKIENLAVLLEGAVESEEIVGLFIHVPKTLLKKILKTLPTTKKPTVTRIAGTNLLDVFTIGREKDFRELIPKLKKMGCEGIVEFPLDKAII